MGKVQLPPFPKKKMGKTDPAFLESRRLQLQSYMTNLIKIPRIVQSKALDSFLMLSDHQGTLLETTEPQTFDYSNNISPLELFRSSNSERFSFELKDKGKIVHYTLNGINI